MNDFLYRFTHHLEGIRNAVILIGAGASKDAGMPIVNDFFSESYFNQVKRYRSSKKYDMNLTYEKYKESQIGFEQLLFEKYESSFDEYSELLNYYESLFFSAETFAGGNSSSEYYSKFAEILRRDFEYPTVISFNHDLFLELGLGYSGINYGPIIEKIYSYSDAMGVSLPEWYKNITLLKMHGSFNFLLCRSCGSVAGGTDNLWQHYRNDLEYGDEGNRCLCKKCKKDLTPFYIPPVENKDYSPLKSTWSHASEALKSASNIFIIGYSLPSYDHSAIQLLKESLNQAAKIYVFDKYAEDLLDRYSWLPNENKRYFQGGFKDVTDKWYLDKIGLFTSCSHF